MGDVKTVTLLKGTMSGLESKAADNAVDPDAALLNQLLKILKLDVNLRRYVVIYKRLGQ